MLWLLRYMKKLIVFILGVLFSLTAASQAYIANCLSIKSTPAANSISIEWDTTNAVYTFNSYKVYLQEQSPYDTLGFGLASTVFNISTTNFTFSNLVSNKTYYFYVSVIDSSGVEFCKTKIGNCYTASQNSIESPLKFKTITFSGNHYIEWNKIDTTNAGKYYIYADTLPNPTTIIDSTSSLTDTGMWVTNLDTNQVHFLRVRGKLNNGSLGGFSEERTVFGREGISQAPGMFNLSFNGNLITHWNPVNANFKGHYRYLVYRGVTKSNLQAYYYSNSVSNRNDTTFSITFPQTSTKYYYGVKAENYNGNRTQISNLDSFIYVDTIPPPAPILTNVISGDLTANVSWANQTFANDIYRHWIYVDTVSSPLNFYGHQFGVDTSINLINLTNNVNYYVQVKAEDLSGNISSLSNVLQFTAQDTTGPLGVTNFTAPIDSGIVSLSWSQTPNFSGDFAYYRLLKKTDTSNYAIIDTFQNIATTNYIDLNVTNGTRYFYKLVSVDTLSNKSAPSPELWITPTNVEVELNNQHYLGSIVNSSLVAQISNPTDDDWFQFTTSGPAEVTIKTDSVYFLNSNVGSNLADTYLELYDTLGNAIIASNDNDPSNGLYSRVTVNLANAGTYYFKVSNNFSNNTGYYKVILTKLEPDVYENNNTIYTASFLADTQLVENLSMYPSGDVDVFGFRSQPNSKVLVSYTNPFYTGTISFRNRLNQTLKTTISNSANFIIPDTGNYFVFYNIGAFKLPSYSMDFKIIPPVSYADSLLITELYFQNSNNQFIEIYNKHNSDIDVSGFSIPELNFIFPSGYLFGANDYLVIANDSAAFFNQYSFLPDFDWGQNTLSVSGQTINFVDSINSVVDYLTYSNGFNGFPSLTDTTASIEIYNVDLNNNVGINWQMSNFGFGTPNHQTSFPRNYVPDISEPNNSISQAHEILFEDSIRFSLSELDDSMDIYSFYPQELDTFIFKINFVDTHLLGSFSITTADSVLTFDSLIDGKIIQFIPQFTDTFFIKLSLKNDGQQFVINEGRATIQVTRNEKIHLSPWFENYELVTETALPNGYRSYDLDVNGLTWQVDWLTIGLDNSKGISLGNNPTGNDDWMILPPASIRKDDFLSFYAKPLTTSLPESFEVYIGGRGATHPSDFSNLIGSYLADSSGFKLYKFDLKQYEGQVIRIAFRGTSVNKNFLFLDNFLISPPQYDASVRGYVTDIDSQFPLVNVAVTDGKNVAYTDTVGYYELDEIQFGNQAISFDKTGYTKATYNYTITQGDTIYQNISLAKTTTDTFYINLFDSTFVNGYSINYSGNRHWQRMDTIIYSGSVITPSEGDSMLVFGSTIGYGFNEIALYTIKSGVGFKLSDYKTIDLKFDINHQIDTSDGLFIYGNGSFIINSNGDSIVDSLDSFTGNSNGWQAKTIDLSYLNNFDDLDVGFLFISGPKFANGFGAALDNIYLIGEKEKDKPAPNNLLAESYIQDTILLTWQKDTASNQSFKIFRSTKSNSFAYYATTTDTFFHDVNVINGDLYNYYVIANYPYGESAQSNSALASPGNPSAVSAPYSVNFNNIYTDSLPAKWGYDLSRTNPWKVGDTLEAKAFNTQFDGTTRFVYGNFFGFNVFGDYYESALTAPWFDFSATTNQIVLSFDKQGYPDDEFHVVKYKDALGSSWKVLDTMRTSWEWQHYKYDITNLAMGKPYFQLAFHFIDDSTKLNTPNVGFAIDNFKVTELGLGTISGIVTSQSGSVIPNIGVEILADNDQNWNFSKSFVTTTDSFGFYSTPIDSIYNSINYTVRTWAWQHDSAIVNNVKLNGALVKTQNIMLNYQLNSPIITALNSNPLGFPIITWKAPKLLGEISYDDGLFATSDSLIPNTAAGIIFSTDATLPAQIAQIAVFGKGGSNSNQLTIRGFKIDQIGQPDLSDTLFTSSGHQITSTIYDWNFINLNQTVDTTTFYLVFYGENGSILNAPKLGYSNTLSQTNSIWKSPSLQTFYNKSEGLLIRAYLRVGNTNFGYNSIGFSGTYNLFSSTNALNNSNLILGGSTLLSFTDTLLQLGDTAYYFLNAQNSFGVSENSNVAIYLMTGKPFADVVANNLDTTLLYGNSSFNKNIIISNIGLDTLSYSADIEFGITNQHNIDSLYVSPVEIKSSKISCYNQIQNGDTGTLNFYLENRNFIGDNHSAVELFFPLGVNVISSSNINVFNSSRNLVSSGQTGDSTTLTWFDPNSNPKGEIYPFEASHFEVEVAIDTNVVLPIKLWYKILGDSKYSVLDTITLGQNPLTYSFMNNVDSLQVGSQKTLQASFSVLQPQKLANRIHGFYKITTNDFNNNDLIYPFTISFDPARGVFRGLVTDDVNNDPLPNTIVQLNNLVDTTDNNGWFYFNEIPTGTYEFIAYNKFYNEGNSYGILLNHKDTSTVLITLTPKVQKPINLSANGNLNKIDLAWQVENFQILYNFEEGLTTSIITNINDWKTVDNDGDGKSWEYYTVGPHQGLYSIASTSNLNSKSSNWLISKKIRVEENNASFGFYAAPQDLNFSEERFVVRVSQTGDSITDFNDSLYSFQFAAGANAYQNFNIPLGSYVGDSIYVAIECVSNQQFKLKLDQLQFNSIQYFESPVDSGIYSFKLFRSKNNGSYQLIDSLSVSNDTILYDDTSVLLDTLYTYFVRSVIPQINQISHPSNFASFRLLSKDIGVTKLMNPETGRKWNKKEAVLIEVTNLGTDSVNKLDTFNIGYTVNGIQKTIQQVSPDTTYGPQEKITFEFVDSAQVSALGYYDFQAWTEFNIDYNNFNDTLKKTIQHKPDTSLPPIWTVDPFNFQYNMSLTAEIFVIDTLSVDSNDMLAAFVNGQVRGVTTIDFIPAFNKWVAQITVYSNVIIENINFKVWDASRDSVFDIIESYTFINNQIYGNLTSPEKLHTVSGANYFDVSVSKQLSPDPLEFNFSNSETMEVRLKNYGTLSIPSGDSLLLYYQVVRKGITLLNGKEAVTFNSDFNNGDSLDFTLNAIINMSDTGTYSFLFYANLPTDVNKGNDSLLTKVLHNPVTDPGWMVNPSNYQYSSFLTAKVFFDDILSIDERDKVAALIKGQVRGVADVEFVSSFGEYVVQMAIYSNVASGENVQFKAFDYSKNEVLWVEEELKFANNAIWGSLVNPERLHAVTSYNSLEENWDKATIKVFPNPVVSHLQVLFPNIKTRNVEIFDSKGDLVFITLHTGAWFQHDVADLNAGQYFLKISDDTGSATFKISVF